MEPKGRTQDPRSGVAEVVQAVHLVVRYLTSIGKEGFLTTEGIVELLMRNGYQ